MAKKKHSKKSKKSLNKVTLKNSMMGIFSNNPTVSYNYKQLSGILETKDAATKSLITTILYELKDRDFLEELYKGKFQFKSRAVYIEGVIDLASQGYGFLVSDDIEEDIFISQSNLKHAINGDRVKVYLYAKRKGTRPEGEVVEIVERARTEFVGTLDITPNFAFLVPDNQKVPFDIFIPIKFLKGAKNGEKAIAKIIEWKQKSKSPTGEVVEVLGKAGDHNVEMHAILAEYGLPHKFSHEIETEADKIRAEITQTDEESRRDFRNITTFTIDPVDAKDFDDALSVQKLENGNWEVGVHIADVTRYIDEHSELDKEALKRGTSVYLVDRVVPMLPERLSNFICSLRPNEEKLCFSAVFELDDNANIKNEWFGRTIINSDRRFTYEEAQLIIETEEGDFSEEVLILDKLAKQLRDERFKTGAIGFDRVEVKFNLDEKGNPLGVYFKESRDSNKLIEEFMLLANKKVAELIGKPKDKSRPKTFVYRIHDKPNPERLTTFSNFIKKFGYKLSLGSDKNISSSLNQLLIDVEGKSEQNVIETLAIRSMAKAVYTTKNIGHYGLSFKHYSHFTSPIRRYPDMMVHRLLDSYLKGQSSKSAQKYEKMCEQASLMEQTAANAERSSIKYKQVEFLQDKIGEEFDGIISGVTEWGIYVEIIENKCEGMVPIRELDDDFYIFDEENYCIVGKNHKRKFQLGNPVTVNIQRADLIKKQLDFKLVRKED